MEERETQAAVRPPAGANAEPPAFAPAEFRGWIEPSADIRTRKVPVAIRIGLAYTAFFALLFFSLYIVAGMYVSGVPDAILFLLLHLMRYSAAIFSVLALTALGHAIHRAAHSVCLVNVMSATGYFAAFLGGALLAVFTLLAAAIAG